MSNTVNLDDLASYIRASNASRQCLPSFSFNESNAIATLIEATSNERKFMFQPHEVARLRRIEEYLSRKVGTHTVAHIMDEHIPTLLAAVRYALPSKLATKKVKVYRFEYVFGLANIPLIVQKTTREEAERIRREKIAEGRKCVGEVTEHEQEVPA